MAHFPVCLSDAFMVISFRSGGKVRLETHFWGGMGWRRRVRVESSAAHVSCTCTCLAKVILTPGGHWPLSPQIGLSSECSWQIHMLSFKNTFQRWFLGSDSILFISTYDHIFVSESQVWVSPVCHSVLTLLFLFPFPCAIPVLTTTLPGFHTIFSVLSFCLPLALAGISLPFRALSPPCRTRPRKAASAQSSRSGGEGGSVHVGMDSKHRWVGACWAPTTSSQSSMCVLASGFLWPHAALPVFSLVD